MKWKTDHSVFRSAPVFYFLLSLLLAAHLPFLHADPDIHISFSRGPFTDEGLNTIQVRNWVNHGHLDLEECDNLLKTPMLGFPLALVYLLFGTHLAISRLFVLAMVLLALFTAGRDPRHRATVIIFMLVSLMQYQVFHFSHFSLAEMLSSASVFLAAHYLARSADLQFPLSFRKRQAMMSAVFISLAWFIKIQFIYLALLLPLAHLFLLLTTPVVYRRTIIRNGFYSSAVILAFLALYLLAWYLPNREAYDFMMAHQSGVLSFDGRIGEHMRFNLNHFFLEGWMQWIVYAFLVCLAGGVALLWKNATVRYRAWFIFSLSWFLLESHKLTMVYLPTRYQVGLLVSAGLLISVVLAELITGRDRNTAGRIAASSAAALVILLFSIHLHQYYLAVERRTYVIRDTNRYLAERLEKETVVLGAWAPSLTWISQSRALPVWNHFLNYRDPINTFKPGVVIAETDEQDSEQAWLGQGIDLSSLADSVKTTKIGQWEVNIYFMKGQ